MSRRVFIVMLALAFALGLSGCGAVADKAGEEIGEEIAGGILGADVEVEGDSVTVETEDGSVTMSSTEGALPDGFPDDFPVYDGAEIDATSTMAGDDSTDFYVNMYSDDAAKDVYEWYKSELVSEGWTIDSDLFMATDGEDSGLLSASKGSDQVSIAVSTEDDRTAFTLVVIVAN